MSMRFAGRILGPVTLIAALAACASTANTPPTPAGSQPSAPAATSRPAATDPAPRQRWLEMFARGYFPGRSGQIFVVPKENDVITDRDPLYRFMHGSPWDYDTRIPVLFYGAPFIHKGERRETAVQQDVAPTIGALLGLPPLPTYTGRAHDAILNRSAGRPRIVVVLVLDGMRADYFDRHKAVMPTLTRMRTEGAWFADGRANTLPTVTGVGHANIGTGSDPRLHGITVNALFNRATGKPQQAYDALDPRELMALTLADAWNLETDGRAVIIGQGGAIRATAGLVGRGSCLVGARKVIAASYSTRDAGWETNPNCYTMPEGLSAFNGKAVWTAAGGRWMGHDISDPSKFRASSLYQKFEAEALVAVLDGSTIGADDVIDLVFVNMKGPDYTGHAHGPESAELAATLEELDRQIAAVLAVLDRKAGAGRSVTVVTADHGMPGEPPPGHRHHPDEILAAINARFDPAGKSIVSYYSDAANNQLWMNESRMKSLGVSLEDVATFLAGQEYFAAVFTADDVRAAQAALRD